MKVYRYYTLEDAQLLRERAYTPRDEVIQNFRDRKKMMVILSFYQGTVIRYYGILEVTVQYLVVVVVFKNPGRVLLKEYFLLRINEWRETYSDLIGLFCLGKYST